MVQNWNYQDRHRRNVPVIVAKSDAICELYNLWDREQDREQERLANAQLIASAPELLDALRWFADELPSIIRTSCPEGVPMIVSDAHDKARAAIAKAEGRDA